MRKDYIEKGLNYIEILLPLETVSAILTVNKSWLFCTSHNVSGLLQCTEFTKQLRDWNSQPAQLRRDGHMNSLTFGRVQEGESEEKATNMLTNS